MERLNLLESQRELAAIRCQRFTDMLEASLSQSQAQSQAQPQAQSRPIAAQCRPSRPSHRRSHKGWGDGARRAGSRALLLVSALVVPEARAAFPGLGRGL